MNKVNNNKKLSSFQELNTLKSKPDSTSLRTKIFNNKKRSSKNNFPNPMLLEGDGIDHINIWYAAETELGKVLSHSYKLEFHHSIFGKFKNIETFWSYVKSKERDDQIRSLTGKPLKQFVHDRLTICQVPNFRAIIMDAHWQRIKSSQPLMEEIRESTLRFDCYYIHAESKIRTRPDMYKWICLGFEEIRKAIKENREPNFKFLLDNKNSGIYDFVHDHILKPEVVEDKTEVEQEVSNSNTQAEESTPSIE